MSSTEFTAGIGEGARISSKVLKTQGGGSSDIFGLGSAGLGANKTNAEKYVEDTSTQNRIFGFTELPPPPSKSLPLHQSNIFQNGKEETTVTSTTVTSATPSYQKSKKVYVRRNPITGEETEICLETENDKNVCDNEEVKEEERADVSSKPVQTSIRIRNPPGGKSSGIF
jgi:hypothetical protein